MFATFEIAVEVFTVTLGIAVLLLGWRVLPGLSFLLHRRAVWIFSFAAVLFLLSELVEMVEALFGQSDAVVVESWTIVVTKDVTEVLVMACIGMGVYLLRRAEREEVSSLRRAADVDDLTSLPNRAFFRRAAERRIALSKENNIPLACALLDVDDFKSYNDRYGHEAGDRALHCVARVLRESARADDIVARYGGEEFVLLTSADPAATTVAAERLRQEIEQRCSPSNESRIERQITVSLGVAPLTPEIGTVDDLVSAADQEMYKAKRAGKNSVSVALGS